MECYVCCDSNPRGLRTNLCECTDRWLHTECQHKLLLTTSKDGRCTVCKAQFQNSACVVDQTMNIKWIVGHIFRGCMFSGMILSVLLLSLHMNTITHVHTRECRLFQSYNNTLHVMHIACLVSSRAMLLGNLAVFMLMLVCFVLCSIGVFVLNRYLRHQPRVWIKCHWRIFDDGADTQKPASVSLDEASM